MQSIEDLLTSKKPQEPPQVAALKQYAQKVHSVDIKVRIAPTHYLIQVPNGAIAHKFRVETATIIETCRLDKRLVIHISS